jgi:hypothetical protein
VLRGVVLIAPLAAGWVTYVVCRELKAADGHPAAAWHAVRRGAAGGYVVEDEEG